MQKTAGAEFPFVGPIKLRVKLWVNRPYKGKDYPSLDEGELTLLMEGADIKFEIGKERFTMTKQGAKMLATILNQAEG